MATPKKSELIKKAREKRAESDDRLDAFSELHRQSRMLKVGEVLEHASTHLGAEQLGKMMADLIKDQDRRVSRVFMRELLAMMKVQQQLVGSVTDNEITRLEDDQIERLLECEYGLKKKEHGKDGSNGTDG